MFYILVRVGEIWLKSAKTRSQLMSRLVANIGSATERAGVSCDIRQYGPRIVVAPSGPNALETCANAVSHVFGVKSLSIGLLVEPTVEQIELASLKLLDGKTGTFRVRVNRAWKGFKYSSPELERLIGSRILEVRGVSLKVDLTNPGHTLGIDVRKEFAFVYQRTLPGPGGLPYGSQGKVLSLFSGGLDSPVASWLVAKRGAYVDHLFINTCCEDAEKQVINVFNALADWYPSTSLYIARTPELRERIVNSVPEGYRQVVYKAYMYSIANQLAEKEGYKSIVTGESLGQVSSQTLSNLATLTSFSKLPVFRPLLGMDKDEIVDVSRRIGLYDESSKTPETCKLETHARTNVPITMAKHFYDLVGFDVGNVDFIKYP